MKLTIDLAETGYPMEKWSNDPDESPEPLGTIQDAIIVEAARQVREELQDELKPRIAEIRREVSNARYEAIENALSAQISAAIQEPIRKTNHYGEPTGPETTLKEMVLEEVRRYLEEKVGDGYSSRPKMTRAESLVQTIVDKEIDRELRTSMDKAKRAATEVIETTATEIVTNEMRKRLGVI